MNTNKKKNKKQVKSILVDKNIYEMFRTSAKKNGFKIKELVEILMKIYGEGEI